VGVSTHTTFLHEKRLTSFRNTNRIFDKFVVSRSRGTRSKVFRTTFVVSRRKSTAEFHRKKVYLYSSPTFYIAYTSVCTDPIISVVNNVRALHIHTRPDNSITLYAVLRDNGERIYCYP